METQIFILEALETKGSSAENVHRCAKFHLFFEEIYTYMKNFMVESLPAR